MSTQIHERFPAITAAATLMALDCGGISSTRTKEQMLEDLDGVLGIKYEKDLRDVDTWLARLSMEQLSTVCIGECSEAAAFLYRQAAPVGTAQLLDEIFNAG